MNCQIQFSSNRPTGPIQSSSQIVCLCVCPCRLFCPHFPKSDVQSFKSFRFLGEKCWNEVVSELNIFVIKWSKIAA